MANLGVLSDTHDSAAEKLISQAKDLYVLEQIDAINLSSFTNSSLPNNLENVDLEDSIVKSGFEKSPRESFGSDGNGDVSDSLKFGSKQFLKVSKEKFRMSSSSFTSIDLASPSSNPDSQEKSSNPKSKWKSKLKSSSSWFNKLAPSRAIGCIWISPSKPSSSSNKKAKIGNSLTSNRENDIDFNEFLSDLGNLSVEEQRKMLKNAKFIKTTK